MTLPKKLVIFGAVAAIGIAVYFIAPGVYLSFVVGRSLREQGLQNEAAKPLFDAVVTKKLKVGDSLDQAKKVLSDAGLAFSVTRDPLPKPTLQSGYRAGRWSGFTIQVELDSNDRISKIDIHEFFTGP